LVFFLVWGPLLHTQYINQDAVDNKIRSIRTRRNQVPEVLTSASGTVSQTVSTHPLFAWVRLLPDNTVTNKIFSAYLQSSSSFYIEASTSHQTDNHANTASVNFYRPEALPDDQPTVSKHWRQWNTESHKSNSWMLVQMAHAAYCRYCQLAMPMVGMQKSIM